MSRKRTLIPDIYKQKKRICYGPSTHLNGSFDNGNDKELGNVPNDTKATVLYLRSLFPLEKFEHRLPPVIFKHQLYSFIDSRTIVDKHINDMQQQGEINLFRLGADSDEYCIVLKEDYRSHVARNMAEASIPKAIADKFLNTVVEKCRNVSVDKNVLINEYHFTDEEITLLVNGSVITVRDIGSWWLSIPNAGLFMKYFMRGRKSLLTMIRRCKYREILKKDLEIRNWPKTARLGLAYHIHDIIGADLVKCIQTTSGLLLRLKE
ncbi:hypothetical protein ACJMK2_033605 [Sinanodonta woodiana]|uniref:Serine/threonine-protein kinase 19 n=1 Tax=Sinanodonta woodiana TaxID=1069815 RepID=A0ABD3WSZ7_SINWO